ncbi:MAG: helix-turn-helix transcriptional regulator [Chloroflexota bacterium]
MPFRGDRLQTLRKEAGIIQADIAEEIGVRKDQISRYETGTSSPTPDGLIVMAQMLNTSADYLLGLSNVPHPGAEPEPDPYPELSATEREMIVFMREYSATSQAGMLRALRALRDAWER